MDLLVLAKRRWQLVAEKAPDLEHLEILAGFADRQWLATQWERLDADDQALIDQLDARVDRQAADCLPTLELFLRAFDPGDYALLYYARHRTAQ